MRCPIYGPGQVQRVQMVPIGTATYQRSILLCMCSINRARYGNSHPRVTQDRADQKFCEWMWREPQMPWMREQSSVM